MPIKYVQQFRDTPPDREAQRRQMLADALTGKALSPMQGPQQHGPVASKMHWGEGIAKLGEAFLARNAQGKADNAARADDDELRARFGLSSRSKQKVMADMLTGTAPPEASMPDLGLGPELAYELYRTNPQGYMQAVAESQKPQELDWKDAGDAWVALDAQGREVQRVAKGASPDAALGADVSMRGQDIGAQTAQAGHGVTMRGQDIGAATSQRGQDIGASTALSGQNVTARGQDISAATTQRGQDIAAASALQNRDIEDDKKAVELEKTWNLYQTAREGLLSGLEGTNTGPLAGRMPAFTSGQQIASGAVSAMAPVLKQLFRGSAEGTFTDKDQDLLLAMVPDRTDAPEARAAKMANIDRIVQAKLGLAGAPSRPEQSDPLSVLTPEQRAKYGL